MSLESETIEKNPSTEPMEIEYEKSERTDFKVQASGRINQMTQKPAMVYNYYRKNSEEIKERETPKDIDSVENRSMQPIFNGSYNPYSPLNIIEGDDDQLMTDE